mmetsp:Transcript_100005/g.291687  ORF Transcript_100005/g.291687 Transcript_100005/m.291687 type:complete len:332 (+) Transcript_100005:1157-2152(+)
MPMAASSNLVVLASSTSGVLAAFTPLVVFAASTSLRCFTASPALPHAVPTTLEGTSAALDVAGALFACCPGVGEPAPALAPFLGFGVGISDGHSGRDRGFASSSAPPGTSAFADAVADTFAIARDLPLHAGPHAWPAVGAEPSTSAAVAAASASNSALKSGPHDHCEAAVTGSGCGAASASPLGQEHLFSCSAVSGRNCWFPPHSILGSKLRALIVLVQLLLVGPRCAGAQSPWTPFANAMVPAASVLHFAAMEPEASSACQASPAGAGAASCTCPCIWPCDNGWNGIAEASMGLLCEPGLNGSAEGTAQQCAEPPSPCHVPCAAVAPSVS